MQYSKTYDTAFRVLMQAKVFKDFEAGRDSIWTYLIIRRLAKRHRRLAEMECNGEGVIRGQFYSTAIGSGIPLPATKSAYLLPKAKIEEGEYGEVTVFDVESDKIEAKINALCAKIGFTVEFQGDPRGNTVKLAYKGRYVEIF